MMAVGGEAERVPNYSDGVVLLTGFTPNDVEAHLAGEDEETARRFGWWPNSSTEETVRGAIDEWAKSWQTNGPVQAFAARSVTAGKLLGGCELRKQPDGSGHVSYWTGAQHRGHGFASRVLSLLCRHAQAEGVRQLEAHIAVDNAASRRVAAPAGFEEDAQFTDEHGTVMLRYVWTARSQPRHHR